MKNKFIILMIIVFAVVISTAVASNLSDPVFDYTSTYLSSTKTATFSAETFNTPGYIEVTSVKLYKKNSNDIWTYVKKLPAPSEKPTNNCLYGSTKDYSSYIGTGTYRLYVTYCADGHSISRYSNTQTY